MRNRDPDYKQRAQIALGVAVISVVFLGETFMVHRVAPHPASPYVWSALAATGIGALAYALWCRLQQRRAGQGDPNSK